MTGRHPPRGRSAAGRQALLARRQRGAAVAVGALFLVLLLAVVSGVTQAWDRAAVESFRPDDAWGVWQQRFLPVIDRFQPSRVYVLLAIVSAGVSLWRRSLAPAVFAGSVATASVVATVALKVVTRRPDPVGDITSTGGSFPSGHVAALLVCVGCCALLFWDRTRWWQWVLVAVPPAVMAVAVSITAAHWVTDVVGGALLGAATLCWAASWPLRTAANRRRLRSDAGDGRRAVVATRKR